MIAVQKKNAEMGNFGMEDLWFKHKMQFSMAYWIACLCLKQIVYSLLFGK